MSGEKLFAEVLMGCDLTLDKDRVLCLSPLGVALEPQPLIASSIYLEWQQVKKGASTSAPAGERLQ